MDIRLTFNAQLPVQFKHREKWVVASCPILDVVSQGETRDAAVKNLEAAIELFLVSCFERGTLDEVLKECGFRPLKDGESARKSRIKNLLNVSIPLSIQGTAGDRELCHA